MTAIRKHDFGSVELNDGEGTQFSLIVETPRNDTLYPVSDLIIEAKSPPGQY